MSISWLGLFLYLPCLCCLTCCDGARILGFFPFPLRSHFQVNKVLLEELAKKGHNVTVLSFFPSENPLQGYTDISLEGLMKTELNALELENIPGRWLPLWAVTLIAMKFMAGIAENECNTILPSAQVQRLLNAKGDFDIAITEQFNSDCFLAVLYKLEIPYIGIRTSSIMPYTNRRFGNPMNPVLVNNVPLGTTVRSSNLISRFTTSFINLALIVLKTILMDWPADRIVRKHIGDVPPVKELAHNTSMMFLNTHFSFHQPRPLVPGVVEIGGFHLRPPKPLPKELQAFVDSANNGVIVFSMGSMINVDTMSQNMKNLFVNVFKSLPQKVIWKINAKIDNLPANVYIMPWIPQYDLLAHPNVTGFIGHGGLGGTLEAIVGGTPYISIPNFGDQFSNVRAGVEAGVAVKIHYADLTEESLRKAINTILSNTYQENVKKLSKQFQDRPLSALDSAIFWVEYILKYGPSAVRTPAVDLNDIEYYLIDVLIVFFGVILLVIYIIKWIFMTFCGCKKKAGTKRVKTC